MNNLTDSRTLAARLFAAGLLLAGAGSALADVHYVDANSTNATPPYTNWTTAATNIQDAVDAAVAGDEVVVTNGIYATGGRAVYGTMTNRVAVDKPLTLRSVNGPQFTVIQGFQVPGTTNGDGAIRCAYLTNGASLSGFTLTNGATRAVVDYPTYREGSGGGLWCETTNAVVVSNCVVVANSAYYLGGGAYQGLLNTCTLSGNSAYHLGGGAYQGSLNTCTLSGNSANYGGGAYYCTLNNCAVTGNSASSYGGGAAGCRLNNCTLSGNSASSSTGGGVSASTLNNCVVYFNQRANYDPSSTLNYCCTTPPPTNGIGNISVDPQLASASYLSAGSPCRGAGNAAYATGTDIDGEAWANPPSIGCDEYHPGAVTGPLSVAIAASFTNVAMGFTVQLTAQIEGRTAASVWDLGDGITATNQPYTSHAWAAPGDYAVVLRAYNESLPGGISATVTVHVAIGVHYVATASANPMAPYTSWATAATNIQDAVDAANVPGALVLVTNGIYAPISAFKILTVRSVNGPLGTVINGSPGRCASLGGNASLSGFTLTNGSATVGGGVWCESSRAVVSNCVITGNFAYDSQFAYSSGGGAYGGTLNNCTLSGNSAIVAGMGQQQGAYAKGGGAYSCTLNNCTLTGNSASASFFTFFTATYEEGGGAYGCTLNNCTLTGNGVYSSVDSSGLGGGGAFGCTLNNCIVYFNINTSSGPFSLGGVNHYGCSINYCCTTPDPGGFGNITNAPVFLGSGSLRLRSNSPCINAGNNAFAPAGPDLDGNPRIAGGTVDVGAYEFQAPVSRISYAWLRQYGLPIRASTDSSDPDGDGLNNWQEWRCRTDPTNALSVLRLLAPATTNNPSGVIVTWQSVAGVNYFLERSASMAAPAAFSSIATNLSGQFGTTSFTDTNAIGGGPFFYRVGVSNP